MNPVSIPNPGASPGVEAPYVAIDEFVNKHNVKLLTAPSEINQAFLKVWYEFAAAEAAKNPFFKKVYESQRAYAAKVVPAKRFMFPPYATQADYYFPPATR